MQSVSAILAASVAWLGVAEPGWSLESTVELRLRGQRIEGIPLRWSEESVHFLGRDGRLWEFPPEEASEYRGTASGFRSCSVSEFRAALLRELGKGFEVSGTGHYLVAHAEGQRDLWAPRFEELYRSFVHYFSVRGFTLSEPQFPLVGIVCRNQVEFQRFSANQGTHIGRGVLGFYSMDTNRVTLFDVGDGKATDGDWKQNAATAIHEATHQTAFNTGIHSRYARPPRWVAEGLAVLFEAPGVHDSRNHPLPGQRINAGRAQAFAKLIPQHRPELLADMIASDRLFQQAPGAAYAEAWALTFYLVETQPRKYADYLARTAKRPPFSDYPAANRLGDFSAVFGDNFRMIEAQFLRFMKTTLPGASL